MIPENGEANKARDDVIQIAQRAHHIEIAIVCFVSAVALLLVVVLAVGIGKLQSYARTNKRLGEQNAQLLKNREQADTFGILAVRCVLDQFALHRNTNQVVHDHMAHALRVDATPVSPLPPLPTDEEVMNDCGPFYRR